MPVRLLLACSLALLLAACGDDDAKTPPAGAGGAAKDWSDPSAGQADVRTPEQLVAGLSDRFARPTAALEDAGWLAEARLVAEALWPIATGEVAPVAARTHQQLVQIARDVALRQARDPLAASDAPTPTQKAEAEILRTYREALANGPDALRTHCAGPGAKLLEDIARARQEELFGPR